MELAYLSSFTQILQEILGAVFDNVLAPVLRDVFNILVNTIGELIQEILSNFLLKIWIIFLKLIGFLEQIFNVFSGVSNIRVQNGDVSVSISMLEYFFRLNEVQTAFMAITAIAVVLAFVTTSISVAKSISDMTFENKRPLSAVLKQAAKAAINFMLIPFTCLFVLQMASKVTAVFNTTFNYEMENQGISDVLFITVARPEAKTQNAVKDFGVNGKYQDAEGVKKNFNIKEFNYIQAYVSSILMALIMLCSILFFIQRLIMVILLYLVSPFFVSMIPLDDGAKFKEWRNMFVAYMASAFGPILCMRIYFMLVPMAVSGGITYPVNGTVEACIHLLFILGGAFAVYKSRLLFVQILDPAAAGSMAASDMIGAFIGGKAMMAVRSITSGNQQKQGSDSQKKSSSQSSGQYKTKSQAYTGR